MILNHNNIFVCSTIVLQTFFSLLPCIPNRFKSSVPNHPIMKSFEESKSSQHIFAYRKGWVPGAPLVELCLPIESKGYPSAQTDFAFIGISRLLVAVEAEEGKSVEFHIVDIETQKSKKLFQTAIQKGVGNVKLTFEPTLRISATLRHSWIYA